MIANKRLVARESNYRCIHAIHENQFPINVNLVSPNKLVYNLSNQSGQVFWILSICVCVNNTILQLWWCWLSLTTFLDLARSVHLSWIYLTMRLSIRTCNRKPRKRHGNREYLCCRVVNLILMVPLHMGSVLNLTPRMVNCTTNDRFLIYYFSWL